MKPKPKFMKVSHDEHQLLKEWRAMTNGKNALGFHLTTVTASAVKKGDKYEYDVSKSEYKRAWRIKKISGRKENYEPVTEEETFSVIMFNLLNMTNLTTNRDLEIFIDKNIGNYDVCVMAKQMYERDRGMDLSTLWDEWNEVFDVDVSHLSEEMVRMISIGRTPDAIMQWLRENSAGLYEEGETKTKRLQDKYNVSFGTLATLAGIVSTLHLKDTLDRAKAVAKGQIH